ncbi:alpha/beta-hydrolase [Westerdykella ornata]|uniref:Alpha/beta-hydrolase n=1 Tax=Westerdykella ornata TaxID=318751 RepID=A0A6A6JD72_WESOR|nr:alpha/beta-hydrolase [Westerdykella ornata]KAF2274217.1 alpha/beta-hydrolase [Westerdykella ornata]
MAKPQIVLVPGAWHTPDCFDIITEKLKAHGYTVHSLQMPAVGRDDNPVKDLEEDYAALREVVNRAIGEGNDVVVVPHSWAGIPVTGGLSGFGKKKRQELGLPGGIVKCAYIASLIIPEGQSLSSVLPGDKPDWWEVRGPLAIVKNYRPFYDPDIPAQEQEVLAKRLKSHSLATFVTPITSASWREIPTSYLLCEDDQSFPAFAQELMTNAAKDMGADIDVQRVKAGHSPFLSQPDAVVDFIRRAAGEKV